MGYARSLKYMGLFIADSIEASGPPDELVITGLASINGRSTNQKTALTDQKKRSWPEGTRLRDFVAKIAAEHGLESVVAETLQAIALPHIDQIDESDINLLSRVARDLDAIAKPGDGKLILAKRGESKTATGAAMPVLSIGEGDLTSWRYRNSVRERVGRVVASYQSLKEGKPLEVSAGQGEPVQRIKRRFPDADTAKRAADADWQRLQRAGRTLSLTMPGDADAMAEAKLQVAGLRPYVDGEWLITRATHILDNKGFRTSIAAEQLMPIGSTEEY